MPFDRLLETLIELVGISSTSGHEEQVRDYLAAKLSSLGMETRVDALGNLAATLPGAGEPILLNAHMDRVPPGLGHKPILRDGVLYSDGTTNLGADDAAGMVIILETLTRVVEQRLPHPPIVAIFTVQEEAGLCGANGFDAAAYHVTQGIVFDNAFEAGVVVSQGAAYEAFDIVIRGRTGHPGKDLSPTVNALEIFRAADYPHGSVNNDQTRILIGRIYGGNARNAVPDTVTIAGELRSYEPPEARQRYIRSITNAFNEAARRFGGQAEVTFHPHSSGYTVSEDEPLLGVYRSVLSERAAPLLLRPTFIGSDASGLRPAVKAFTISTGVVNEHSVEESVAIEPLEQLVNDTLRLLAKLMKV